MGGPLLALLLQSAPFLSGSWALPATRACSAQEMRELTAAPDAADTPFRLTCRAGLNGRPVLRRVLIEGAEASGAGVDCGGGSLGRPGARTTTQTPTVAIWSRRIDGAVPLWSRPTDIFLRNCTVHGAIRIWGMGVGGRIDDLRNSSRTPGHTVAAQAAGPSHISLTGLSFTATGSIPLYVGPGVTQVTVDGGRFGGRSDSTAVYLDAESAGAVIRNVGFDIRTPREIIAVDGSARNTITGNRFVLGGHAGSGGGVFLYRNCGEDGVIRHQTPSDNVITDNVFTGASLLPPRTVVVGAREGGRRYCGDDRGWPFGSSLDDGDHATGNIVARNRTVR
jgi:hypothetical protein